MSNGIPYEQIPSGWYVVATSDELKKSEVKKLRYFGRDLVLYRTESGSAYLTDAYCPHLGAHLGGGCVERETIVCPFHGFAFDGSGQCVSTPYKKGTPPKRARLDTLPVSERNGFILAYHAINGENPTWEVPVLDMEGWRDFRFHSWTFRGHPQETSENSVDIGHFGTVHRYASAMTTKEFIVEGPMLKSGYAVHRSLDWIGFPNRNAEMHFEADVHGLGYSLVRAGVEEIGIHVRLLVLPTPIEKDLLHLRIACAVKEFPIPIFTSMIHEITLRAYAGDVSQDLDIWKNKRFIEKPPLADGDGPIGLYRKWCQQFYESPSL